MSFPVILVVVVVVVVVVVIVVVVVVVVVSWTQVVDLCLQSNVRSWSRALPERHMQRQITRKSDMGHLTSCISLSPSEGATMVLKMGGPGRAASPEFF